MAALTIGKFNRRVTFRQVTKTSDDAEGNSEVYADWISTWAHIEDQGGRRDFLSNMDKVIDNKDVYVFYRTDLMTGLTKDTRIAYDGKEYGIDRHSMVDEVKRIVKFETSGTR